MLIGIAVFIEFSPVLTDPLSLIFIPLTKLIASSSINVIFEAEFIYFNGVFIIGMILNNLATCFAKKKKMALILKSMCIIVKKAFLIQEISY